MSSRGGARQKAERWYANTRYGNGERLEFRVPAARSEADALERARIMGEIADALVEAGRRDLVRAAVRKIAEATTSPRLEKLRKASLAIAEGSIKAGHARDITVRQWGERYTSGELSRLWPDHVKAKDWGDDRSRLVRYVYPIVGEVPLTAFAFEHASKVLEKLPPDRVRRDATRRHVAQIIGRLMHIAVFPGRLIPVTPLPRGWLPKIQDRRAYSCLYPREEAKHLAHEETPIAFRLFCGVLNREGMRLSELLDSGWKQWNLTEGVFSTEDTKTNDPRMWALRPDVTEAMRAWREHLGGDAAPAPFAGLLKDVFSGDRTKIAEAFRDSLRAAGVDREELFETTKNRGRLRAHDMRATFVTVSLAEGKNDTWIRDRTAHKSTSMIDRYRRAARQFAELALGSLVHLAEGLGWRKGGGNVVISGGGKEVVTSEKYRRRDSNPHGDYPADFESDAASRPVAKPQQLPEESSSSKRSDLPFHHSSTTPTATIRDGGGGPERELEPTTSRRPGLASAVARGGAVGARLEAMDGRLLAQVDVADGESLEDVAARLRASQAAGGRRR